MRTVTLYLAVALATMSSAFARDPLPEAVLQAIEARWPGSEILDAHRDDGGYDVDLLTARGVELDIDITAGGRILDVDVDRDRRDRRDDRHDDDDDYDDDYDDDHHRRGRR